MKKGFTLVELLIVLAVIAALMSVATPLALNAVRNAKASQVAQNFRNLKAAIENYWNTDKPTPTAAIGAAQLVPGYINTIPANFTIGTPSAVSGQPGAYSITITYAGGDVEGDRVRANGMGEVSGTTGNLTLTFTLQKWW